MASVTRFGEAFTRDDLEDMPDDGHRYDLRVVVGGRAELTEREITRPRPVGEVLSYSTRLYDTHVKWERFERAGIRSYWMVHPSARPAEAALIGWELDGNGRYREVAKATGERRFEATLPFPVTVVPADLVRL